MANGFPVRQLWPANASFFHHQPWSPAMPSHVQPSRDSVPAQTGLLSRRGPARPRKSHMFFLPDAPAPGPASLCPLRPSAPSAFCVFLRPPAFLRTKTFFSPRPSSVSPTQQGAAYVQAIRHPLDHFLTFPHSHFLTRPTHRR